MPAWSVGSDREIGLHYTKKLTERDYARMYKLGWKMSIIVKPIQGTYMFGWATPLGDQTTFKPGSGATLILDAQEDRCIIRSNWGRRNNTIKVEEKDYKNGLFVQLRGEPGAQNLTMTAKRVGVNGKVAGKIRTTKVYFRPLKEFAGLAGWTVPDSKAEKPASFYLQEFRLRSSAK